MAWHCEGCEVWWSHAEPPNCWKCGQRTTRIRYRRPGMDERVTLAEDSAPGSALVMPVPARPDAPKPKVSLTKRSATWAEVRVDLHISDELAAVLDRIVDQRMAEEFIGGDPGFLPGIIRNNPLDWDELRELYEGYPLRLRWNDSAGWAE